MMILIGILLVLGGAPLFVASTFWMYWVTTEGHHPGTFVGQFWSTVGQEVVAVFMLLSWAIVVYGLFWIVGVPLSWSVFSVFLTLFLPTVVIWGIAKLFAIKGMLIALGGHIIQMIYTVTVLWAVIGLFGIPTFVPSRPINEYYGKVESPNQFMWRLGETILVIDQLRFFRSELGNSSSLHRYLVESKVRMDEWHTKRESWGGLRNLNEIDYIQQSLPLFSVLKNPSIDTDPAANLFALILVLTTTDSWWLDELPDLSQGFGDPENKPDNGLEGGDDT